MYRHCTRNEAISILFSALCSCPCSRFVPLSQSHWHPTFKHWFWLTSAGERACDGLLRLVARCRIRPPLWMPILAIAVGNAFILKPSERTPFAAVGLTELALEAGVPPGILDIVHGREDVAQAITDHPDIKAVSFVDSRVGLLALPLAMAFAIASGVPPQAGLYTAVVAWFLISALGGSCTQIGEPAGAFLSSLSWSSAWAVWHWSASWRALFC